MMKREKVRAHDVMYVDKNEHLVQKYKLEIKINEQVTRAPKISKWYWTYVGTQANLGRY